jgi:PAS domain S-box-containing protein
LPAAGDEVVDLDVARLAHDLRQFQEFLDGLPDAIIDIELKSGRVSAINRMTTIVLGYGQEDVDAGLDAFALAPPDEAQRLAQVSAQYIQRGLTAGNGRYARTETYEAFDTQLITRGGRVIDAEVQASYVIDESGRPIKMRVIMRDITERKAEARARQQLVEELQAALSEVNTLRGLIPICAWCHSIRDDQGYWQRLEAFLSERAQVEFTHGICEPCAQKFEAPGGEEASG